MMRLRVVQSRFGDCLILQNGYGKRRKYVLVDGGPARVYEAYLRPELLQIAASGGKLDLVVLTHVDNDHVVGLLGLMNELVRQKQAGLPPLIGIGGLWHNGFSKILPREIAPQAELLEQEELTTPLGPPDPGDAGPFGVAEGHALQLADIELGVSRNAGFPDELVTAENAPRSVRVGGMWLRLIGPPARNLERMREKWVRWLMKEHLPFAPGEEPVKPDDSDANLSSIMFLAEAGKRRILLTGDGLGDDILAGLERAGLLPPDGSMYVDVFKVPHHGSARNAVGRLFERVQAGIYLLCADGKYDNPDWQTLVWMVDAACQQGRDIRIVATNPAPSLTRLLAERPPEKNHYTLEIMPRGASAMLL